VLYAAIWKFSSNRFGNNWLIPAIVLAVGAGSTILNAWGQENSAQENFDELFGSKKERPQREIEENNSEPPAGGKSKSLGNIC
jgi:hypothetical protein